VGRGQEGGLVVGEGRRDAEDVLNTKISRIKTMNPSTPPLVPYFQVLPWVVAASVSSAMAKETRRRLSTTEENIVAAAFLREFVSKIGIDAVSWRGRGSCSFEGWCG
jgi:hypothetical protein